MLPREEGQDRARMADLVAVIQMIGRGIVEVHGLFHESETERARVEVEIAMSPAANRCDMMKSRHARLSRCPWAVISGRARMRGPPRQEHARAPSCAPPMRRRPAGPDGHTGTSIRARCLSSTRARR